MLCSPALRDMDPARPDQRATSQVNRFQPACMIYVTIHIHILRNTGDYTGSVGRWVVYTDPSRNISV